MTHPTRDDSGPWLREAQRLIEARGLEVSCVSGGGTPAALSSHLVGAITELRVGTYVYRDRKTSGGAFADCALRVRSTVVSTPTRDRVILDAGSKTLTNDLGLPSQGATFGTIVEHAEAVVYQLSEEHGHVDVSLCNTPPRVGDVVTVIPNHACATVNLHSEVALHRQGSAVSVIPVAGRGLVR
jgi:D-serine deaminase-like pyridoxal phosphate-dependent protein